MPHNNQNKIIVLTMAPQLLQPIFAIPDLYFFKESASDLLQVSKLQARGITHG